MDRNEIGKFIDRTWGQGKSDMPTILNELKLSHYQFDKDEILEIINSINNKNGLISTPNNLCNLISIIGHISNPKSVIDICCGTGNILQQFKNVALNKGIDINKDVIQLAELINPISDYEIFDSLKYDFGETKYDIVVGSLPFGIRTKDGKSLEIELIKKGLSLLEQNGYALLVVSENILTENTENEFRRYLLSEFAIDMVISLPNDTFYPYLNIKTALLVIRNGKQSNEIFMPVFENEPYTLINNFKTHMGNFFCPISKINNRLDRNYYLKVDITSGYLN
jgi:type I restriction-modification system DNA methylase subunit